MNGSSDGLVALVCGTALLLTVLCGIFFLAWKHVITGGELVAIVSSIVSIAAGAFAVHSGVTAGSKAAALGQGTNGAPPAPPAI